MLVVKFGIKLDINPVPNAITIIFNLLPHVDITLIIDSAAVTVYPSEETNVLTTKNVSTELYSDLHTSLNINGNEFNKIFYARDLPDIISASSFCSHINSLL